MDDDDANGIEVALKEMADDYDGSPLDLLQGIAFLARLAEQEHRDTGIELLTRDFTDALERYKSYTAWTLDDAFGLAGSRKGWHKAAHRFMQSNGWKIYCDVEELRLSGGNTGSSRVHDSVFQTVAKKYPRGASSISQTYYNVRDFLHSID